MILLCGLSGLNATTENNAVTQENGFEECNCRLGETSNATGVETLHMDDLDVNTVLLIESPKEILLRIPANLATRDGDFYYISLQKEDEPAIEDQKVVEIQQAEPVVDPA